MLDLLERPARADAPQSRAPELSQDRGWMPDWALDARPDDALYTADRRALTSGHSSHGAVYAHPRTVPPVPYRLPPGARRGMRGRLRAAARAGAAMSAVAGAGTAGLLVGAVQV